MSFPILKVSTTVYYLFEEIYFWNACNNLLFVKHKIRRKQQTNKIKIKYEIFNIFINEIFQFQYQFAICTTYIYKNLFCASIIFRVPQIQ